MLETITSADSRFFLLAPPKLVLGEIPLRPNERFLLILRSLREIETGAKTDWPLFRRPMHLQFRWTCSVLQLEP